MILVLSSLSSEVVTIFFWYWSWWSVVAITRGFLCRRSYIDQGLFPRINHCVFAYFTLKWSFTFSTNQASYPIYIKFGCIILVWFLTKTVWRPPWGNWCFIHKKIFCSKSFQRVTWLHHWRTRPRRCLQSPHHRSPCLLHRQDLRKILRRDQLPLSLNLYLLLLWILLFPVLVMCLL